jgi:hypothetical protein
MPHSYSIRRSVRVPFLAQEVREKLRADQRGLFIALHIEHVPDEP